MSNPPCETGHMKRLNPEWKKFQRLPKIIFRLPELETPPIAVPNAWSELKPRCRTSPVPLYIFKPDGADR
jgi:hypothetical protein